MSMLVICHVIASYYCSDQVWTVCPVYLLVGQNYVLVLTRVAVTDVQKFL